MRLSKSFFLLFSCFLLSLSVITSTAQERLTEETIALQQLFIEATQQKLLENYDKAILLYKQVLKEDKKNHAAAYELARIHLERDEDDKAEKNIEFAVSLDQENLWYQKLMADIYQKTGNDAKAAKVYETLVSKEPNNEYYYYKWAYFLVKSDEIDDAIKVYDKLEAKTGINEEIARRKYTLYLGTGNPKKAVKELERLIAAFPKEVDYYHLLANYYEQSGDDAQAKSTYETILRIDPNNVKAKLGIAGMSSEGQNELLYLETLASIFENPEVDIDLKIGKIFPFIGKVAETGDQDIAVATLKLTDILERVHPQEAKSYSAGADLLYYSGKRLEALEKYKKTIELDESVFMVWEQVMYIYLQEADYDALLETTEKALDIYPNQAMVYFMSGVAHESLDQAEEAIEQFEQALLMSSNNERLKLDIYARLGSAYFNLKKYTESDEAFEEALKISGQEPGILNNYSYYLSVRGVELEKAKTMSALSNELAPNQSSFQDTYGWILYKLKDYKGAQEWLLKALENGGKNSPTILEHAGDVFFQLNDTDQAIKYWTEALEKGSKSSLLEKKIADRKLYE